MRLIMTILISCSFLFSGQCLAQSPLDMLIDDYIAQAAQKGQELASMRERIESGDYEGAEQSAMDVKEYLWLEVQMVYLGKTAANLRGSSDVLSSNDDLSVLAEAGFLPYWPGNPLNNWEATRTLTMEDNFSAGDIVLSLCPSSEYTSTRGLGTVPLSFDLYVYGFDIVPALDANVWTLQSNKSWSVIPEGAQYSQSFHMASDAERRRAKELTEPIIAAEKAAEAEQETDGTAGDGE